MAGIHFQRPTLGWIERRAEISDAAGRPKPLGGGIALQCWSAAGSLRRTKVEHASLRAGVSLDLQRVVVLPGDVQARGYAHQTSRAVSLALIARGFVLGRIPFLGHLLPCWIQGHSRE